MFSSSPFLVAADETLPEVLRCYAVGDKATVMPLGNHGGFSGAQLWRVFSPAGEFCLRRWPAGVGSRQLTETHRLIDHAGNAGLTFVPHIQRTRDGKSMVSYQDRLWEVESWLPGKADFHRQPTAERIANALTAVARIHHAWQSAACAGSCPAIQRRLVCAERWQKLLATGWQPRLSAEQPPAMNLWAQRAWPIVRERTGALALRLQISPGNQVPLQPCLCDIWHDHVLFSSDTVTGIVDYGSVRIDHVAVDLARLIGSMAGDDQQLRESALEAYRRQRALSADDTALMELLDESGTLLGAANWLMWVYHDGRLFPDMEKAALRLAALVQRLEI